MEIDTYTPPINILSLNVQTLPNSLTKKTEIVTISGFSCKNSKYNQFFIINFFAYFLFYFILVEIHEQQTATSAAYERFSITRPLAVTGVSLDEINASPSELNINVIKKDSEKALLECFLGNNNNNNNSH